MLKRAPHARRTHSHTHRHWIFPGRLVAEHWFGLHKKRLLHSLHIHNLESLSAAGAVAAATATKHKMKHT